MRDKLHAVWAYVCTIDPGTMRSLIWTLLPIVGIDQGETALGYIAGAAMFALGVASAIMPPKPRP